MAVFALLNQYLLFNSVDFSDHLRQATLALDADDLDASAASAGGWKVHLGGLKGGQIQIEVLDDFAAASIDATLWAAFVAGTAVAFEVRPVNSTRSTTNPGYTGNILPIQYTMGGQLNTVAAKSITLPVTGAVARQTT